MIRFIQPNIGQSDFWWWSDSSYLINLSNLPNVLISGTLNPPADNLFKYWSLLNTNKRFWYANVLWAPLHECYFTQNSFISFETFVWHCHTSLEIITRLQNVYSISTAYHVHMQCPNSSDPSMPDNAMYANICAYNITKNFLMSLMLPPDPRSTVV